MSEPQPFIMKYPLDLSGLNPSNQVYGEAMKVERVDTGAFVGIPDYAPFFTESLIVKDEEGNTLTPHVDYKCIYMDEELTRISPKEICAAVYITKQLPNHDIPGHEHYVDIEYRTVGYPYTSMVGAIKYLTDLLNNDQRPVRWGKLIERPTEFRPDRHFHPAGDLYGLDNLILAMEEIRAAIVGVYNHNDPNNVKFKLEHLRMLQSCLNRIDSAMERVNVVETNTTKFLEDMAQIYAQSAFADWVPGVVTLNGPMVLPDPVTVPYLVEGVPDDCTATIESDLTSWFDKTTDIEEGEQILLNVAPIDPGHYTIALYATAANGARTLKNYLSIEVAI